MTYCNTEHVGVDGRLVLCSRPADHPGPHNALRLPEDDRPPSSYTIPARPSRVGQRVRFIGHGGRVAAWMVGAIGTVHRFTRRGNPVILFVDGNYSPGIFYVTDTYGCASLIDDDDRLMRVEVTAATCPHEFDGPIAGDDDCLVCGGMFHNPIHVR